MSEKNVTSINLYCANCGTKLGGAKDVCPSCGRVIGPEQYAAIPRTGAAGVGYSEITGHPTFDAYRKHTGKVQMILLPVIAVVVFVISSHLPSSFPDDGGGRRSRAAVPRERVPAGTRPCGDLDAGFNQR